MRLDRQTEYPAHLGDGMASSQDARRVVLDPGSWTGSAVLKSEWFFCVPGTVPEARTSFHLPQPGLKALPKDWRPVRCLPRVLVGVAYLHDARAELVEWWKPQPGPKALPGDWRPVRSLRT